MCTWCGYTCHTTICYAVHVNISRFINRYCAILFRFIAAIIRTPYSLSCRPKFYQEGFRIRAFNRHICIGCSYVFIRTRISAKQGLVVLVNSKSGNLAGKISSIEYVLVLSVKTHHKISVHIIVANYIVRK